MDKEQQLFILNSLEQVTNKSDAVKESIILLKKSLLEANTSPVSYPKGKVILTPKLANYLLQRDFRILNLKAHYENKQKTVYVFAVEKGFDKAIEDYNRKYYPHKFEN